MLKVIVTLLGLGLIGLTSVSQATPFYAGPLWDAHSHVDVGSSGNKTRADIIAGAINGAPAGTLIPDGATRSYVLPQDLPGVGRITLFPKEHLDGYMLATLATDPLLQNHLITSIGFQNSPSSPGANDGWRFYESTDPVLYNPAEDAFLNLVETRAASGIYQWLGEVALYGKEGAAADVKADLFDPVIEARILRVLDIAANNNLTVTIHHTVTDTSGNPIGDLIGGTTTETAAERFISILQTHVDNVIGEPADVVWSHWGGLSTPQALQGMFNQFPNLYFDLAWFNKGLTDFQPVGVVNMLLDQGCNIENLMLCEFTPAWKALISRNPGRFLAGMDAGKSSEYLADYQVRELILRTALGTLDATDAQLIAAGNLKELSGFVPVPADGDITRDGAVNVADIQLGLQVLGGTVILSSLQFKHGDVAPLVSGVPAPDGEFGLPDVLLITRKALGFNF